MNKEGGVPFDAADEAILNTVSREQGTGSIPGVGGYEELQEVVMS